MRKEIKKQKMQHLADLIAGPSLAQSSPWSLWPESQLGGDGPWNNYGDEEEEEGAPPIAVDVPPITVDVPPITVDVTFGVPPHDFIPF
jgi:hypothetical protein